MKKILILFAALAMTMSCTKYDDTWIKEEFAEINERLNELKEVCKKINEDLASVRNMLNAIQQNEFVTAVNEITENGETVGYEICFSKSKSVKIYHGKDGVDGHIPQVSVKQDTDGIWYWTVDGEWMKDAQGNKVSTLGREDLTPQMKIENEFWFISYDNGKNWTKLNKAVGEDGSDGKNGTSYFKGVEHDNEYVYVTLIDGNILKLPKLSNLDITFEHLKDIPCNPGQTLNIPYTLTGVTSSVEVITICEGNWDAEVKKSNETTGYIVVTVPEVVDESQILVIVSDSRKNVMKTLTFTEGVFTIGDTFKLADGGGELSISLSTNYEYNISTTASWITSIETKAIRNERVVIKYGALPSGTATRSAEILFKNNYSGVIKKITLVQGSPVSLSSKTLQLLINDEHTLTASSLLGHKSFVWYSSDSNIVRVDSNGKLTTVAKGTATITVMTSDYNYSATCTVTVCSISDLITTKFGSATNVSYSNGIVGKGTKLSWKIYNNSNTSIVVNALQLNDSATGYNGNKMTVNETLGAGQNTGWTITLGTSYQSPYCRFYFTYNGKEYTQDCASIF